MATAESEETTAKTPQSGVSDSAITVLFGKDHTVESSARTNVHIDPMDWWKTNKNRLAKLASAHFCPLHLCIGEGVLGSRLNRLCNLCLRVSLFHQL